MEKKKKKTAVMKDRNTGRVLAEGAVHIGMTANAGTKTRGVPNVWARVTSREFAQSYIKWTYNRAPCRKLWMGRKYHDVITDMDFFLKVDFPVGFMFSAYFVGKGVLCFKVYEWLLQIL